jgi:O-succinylbenzoic acid--CoA ligase
MSMDAGFCLQTLAQRYGPLPAVIDANGIVTYDRFIAKILAAARRLKGLGIAQGQRVCLLGETCSESLILIAALWLVNAVAVLLSTRTPAGQVPGLMQRVASTKLFVDAGNRVDGFPARLFDQVLSGPRPGPFPVESTILLDQPATLIFSSGSTGVPKAALHTFGNHYFSALGANANIALAPGHRCLLSLPLYHVGGLAIFVRALVAGATVVIAPRGMPMTQAMETFQITHASMVATQLFRWLRDTGKPKRTEPRAIVLGGSRIPAALVARAHGLGLPVHTSYGCTEMASQVTTTAPGASLDQLLSSGRLLCHRRLKIAEDGEILVQGATLFLGYVEGGRIRRPDCGSGWFPTGDIGTVNDRKLLHVIGRKDNMFVSGGENIHPEEIEANLCRLPGIIDAIVVAIADEEFGHRPVAFVQTGAGTALCPETIHDQLAETCARFKRPVAYLPWEGPPEGGKPDRSALQAMAAQILRRKEEKTFDLP